MTTFSQHDAHNSAESGTAKLAASGSQSPPCGAVPAGTPTMKASALPCGRPPSLKSPDPRRREGRDFGLIVGVDNGLSGALVAISTVAGLPPVAMLPMPTQRARKGNEIDVRALWQWIRQVTGDNPASATVVVEEPGGSKSYTAATSMAGSFHAIRALLDVHGLRWHRVTPQAWQKAMLPGCAKGETKGRALEAARRLWPGETWLETPRSKVASAGLVDAALIAEYGRVKQL